MTAPSPPQFVPQSAPPAVEPSGRHRRRPPSWWIRLGSAAALLAALVVGNLILAVKPDQERFQRPFIRAGEVGEPVSARTFDITVVSVTGGKQIAIGGVHPSAGVWIVVTTRLEAHDEPQTVGYAALVDAKDRTYLHSRRTGQSYVGGTYFQPGLPMEIQMVFEVPADATGLRLRVARPSELGLSLEAMVEIPLPVDAAKLRDWGTVENPIPIGKPRSAA